MTWREQVCDSEPMGGMIVTTKSDVLVGYGGNVAVVDAASGEVSKRHALPGNARGFAPDTRGRVKVCYSPEGGKSACFALIGDDGVAPLFELPGKYLSVLAASPSGRFVFGFSGLDHMVVDLETKATFPIHKGLGFAAAFLDEELLLEVRQNDLSLDAAPRWERTGTIDLKVKHLAASKNGALIAAVGAAKGIVWTREELLAALDRSIRVHDAELRG